jgi:hypothetical protein
LALKAALCRFRFAFISLLFLIYSKPAKIETYPWSNFRGPPLQAATKELEQKHTEKTETEKLCQKCPTFRYSTAKREKPFAPSRRCAFALKNRAMRGKMLAKRHAAGLGFGNLKAGIADNGSKPLFHGKRPGPNWISIGPPREYRCDGFPANVLRHAGRKGNYALMRD